MKGVIFILAFLLLPFEQEDPYQADRERMVSRQIEARGVKDLAVLQAMRTVPRHEYVPTSRVRNAYEDRPLPIGHGQTISQPYIVGYMTEVIGVGPEDRVLEIGTGSGYQAAVLAEIVDAVYTIEIIEALGTTARKRLMENYNNVQVKIADGYYGWPEAAPFDAIVVTAAAEFVPPPLTEQLKEGGKMIIPVGSPFRTQQLMLITKEDGQVRTESLMPVKFVPFKRGE